MMQDLDDYAARFGLDAPELIVCPCVSRKSDCANPRCELCGGSGEITDDQIREDDYDDLDD